MKTFKQILAIIGIILYVNYIISSPVCVEEYTSRDASFCSEEERFYLCYHEQFLCNCKYSSIPLAITSWKYLFVPFIPFYWTYYRI